MGQCNKYYAYGAGVWPRLNPESLIYIIIIIFVVVASQIIITVYNTYIDVMCLSWKCQRCLSLRRHTDMGMNDKRFLFVFYVILIVLNLLDKDRRMYSSCKILNVLSFII